MSSSPTVFEQQREELVREIAVGMEQVLGNVNRLNRNLESIIAVGNEFGSVEALWSQFEHFMGRPDAQGVAEGGPEGQDEHQHAQGQDHGQDIKQEEPEEGESTVMK